MKRGKGKKRLKPVTALSGTVYRLASSTSDHRRDEMRLKLRLTYLLIPMMMCLHLVMKRALLLYPTAMQITSFC